MQTFLPSVSFKKSAKILDWKRLGKQRVEALQILNSIIDPKPSRWNHHPARLMWIGYEDCLIYYMNTMIQEWKNRGYNNTMIMQGYNGLTMKWPPWLGKKKLHS